MDPEERKMRGRPAALVALIMVILQTAGWGAEGWRDDLTRARIPDTPARGRIRGVDFKVELAELRGSHLHLRQGKEFFAEREFVILMRDPQSALQGKKFNLTDDDEMGGPHVHMSWKPKGATLPKTRIVLDGYLLRLELGRISSGRLPGKIYLCMPDIKRSYLAGSFEAVIK